MVGFEFEPMDRKQLVCQLRHDHRQVYGSKARDASVNHNLTSIILAYHIIKS